MEANFGAEAAAVYHEGMKQLHLESAPQANNDVLEKALKFTRHKFELQHLLAAAGNTRKEGQRSNAGAGQSSTGAQRGGGGGFHQSRSFSSGRS